MDQLADATAAEELEDDEMTEFATKDIFRASRLSFLGVSNSHVEKDSAQIGRNEKLSPLLDYKEQNERHADYRRRKSLALRGLPI
jgi:hypothetical protein